MGRMVHKDSLEWLQKNKLPEYKIQVQCVPLYSLHLALNQTKIHLLSIDIEGDELFVLQTIPFEKVDIRTIIVEYSHVPGGEERDESFLVGKGYRTLKKDITRFGIYQEIISNWFLLKLLISLTK